MQKEAVAVMFALIALAGISANHAYSQEIGLATFQETVQIIVDKSVSQNVTASITLQSNSIQEIRIPAQLEQQIRENEQITTVIFTNQDECITGIIDKSCIIINIALDPENDGIFAIQDAAREISKKYIDEINQVFNTDATFHSIFIHSSDQTNKVLENSGIVSGEGVISAVYTLPMEKTGSMYEKISAILIPKIIREEGGFYDIAKNLSSDKNAKMTFSLIPEDSYSLLQLNLSVEYPDAALGISRISPLEFLKIDKIDRSGYFSGGFYPLNSLIQVIVVSPEDTSVSDVKGDILATQVVDDEKIPLSVTEHGWIFDPEQGKTIQGKYIFGEETSVSKEMLEFSLGEAVVKAEKENIQTEEPEFDESVVVLIIIVIVAIAAAVFYLKGYKK